MDAQRERKQVESLLTAAIILSVYMYRSASTDEVAEAVARAVAL